MVMRHWQRALRRTSASLLFRQYPAAISGSDVLGQPCSSLQSSPPPVPAMQDFARHFSSADSLPRSKLSEPNDLHGYNVLIQTIIYKKRPNLVRHVYEDMLLDGIKPSHDTFLFLIHGCMKDSRLQDVMYFFEEMKAMGLTPGVVLYNYVIAACGRSLQVDHAFKVLREMEASGIQPKHRTFLTLLRSCAIAGRVDEAYGIVRQMAEYGLSLGTIFYSTLIMAHKNQKPHTKDTTQKILDLLEQSKKQSAEDRMALAATGEYEALIDMDDGLVQILFDDIKPRRGYLDRRLAVYHAAVISLSAIGDREAVKTVLKFVEKDGHEPDSFCTIHLVKCYLAEGDFEKACAEFSKYVDDKGKLPPIELYVVLIEGAINNGTSESSAIAQKLLADFVEKRYFLNIQFGTRLLLRALKQPRNMVVANIVWDLMTGRKGARISKFICQEYYKALESSAPKDDPRLIAVRALVDEGSRVELNRRASKAQTAPSDQVPGQTALSEQDFARTKSSEIPSDELYEDPLGSVVADQEFTKETDSCPGNLNLPPAEEQG